MYDKLLVEAANGEDMFRTALTALSTATEEFSANQEIVHAVRKCIGAVHFPLRLKADLKQIACNVESLKKMSNSKRKIMNNLLDIASVTRKVADMNAYIKEEVVILQARASDYESDDRFTPEPDDNDQKNGSTGQVPAGVKRRADVSAAPRRNVKKNKLQGKD